MSTPQGAIGPQGWSDADVRAYDAAYRQRRSLFDAALYRLNQALNAILDASIPQADRMRYRVEPGRVKSANRLLAKVQGGDYPEIASPEEVFTRIRDVVGTRITCNTHSDVSRVRQLIEEHCVVGNDTRTLTHLESRDYITQPLPSGYRALHLIVTVDAPRGLSHVAVPCEIQVRTLLQDAWGELTHEDTYKPGVQVPRLVGLLSQRLATALAAMDDIAQDLRAELDSVASGGVHALDSAHFVPSSSSEQIGSSESSRTSETDPARAASVTEASRVALAGVDSLVTQEISQLFEQVLGVSPREPDALTALRLKLAPPDLDVLRARLHEASAALSESDVEVDEVTAEVVLSQLVRKQQINIGELAEERRRREQNFNEAEAFAQAYPVGSKFLGTVVHQTSDYALVQAPRGDTGMLHASSFPEAREQFIDVGDFVRQGDTVRVEVLESDAASKRMQLRALSEEDGNSREG